MKKSPFLILTIALLQAMFFLSCAASRKELRLDPESEDFLSHTRYIITREESKIFMELPSQARHDFIEEFWRRRDPIPETLMNEYREAYFQRIEDANRLFKGGRPGWLQDRGHIYVLFGPPNERVTNPMGGRPIDPFEDAREMTTGRRVATGEKPTEVWIYYNLFSSFQQPRSVELVFVDSYGTGEYVLSTNLDEVIPGGIDALLNPDLRFTHELYKQETERARLYLQRALFDFSWELLKQKNRELSSNLLIHLVLPYKKIIFKAEEERLRAKMELTIRIIDVSEKVIWKHEKEYDLDFTEKFIEENKETEWGVEVPVTLWLNKGKYSVYIRLKNPLGDQTIEKLLSLKI
jgi:GWxTD domain-containing protein